MPNTTITVKFEGKDSNVTSIIDKITSALQKLDGIASKASSSVSSFLDTVNTKAKETSDTINQLNQAIKDAGGKSGLSNIARDADTIKTAMAGAKDGVTAAANGIQSSFSTIQNEIVKVTTDWRLFYEEVARPPHDTSIVKVTDDFKTLDNEIERTKQNWKIFNETQEKSPLQLTGPTQPQGPIQGPQLPNFGQSLQAGLQPAQATLQAIGSTAYNIFTTIGTYAAKAGSTILSAFQSIGSVVGAALGSVASQVVSILNPVNLVKGAVTGVIAVFTGWNSVINNLTAGMSSHIAIVRNIAIAYNGLKDALSTINDAIRSVGQGFSDVGRGMQQFGALVTATISLPVGAWLKGIITEAISFNDVLIEARRNTGLYGDELKQLSTDISELSTKTPTAREGLLSITNALGKSGISDENALVAETASVDKLAVATKSGGAEIATNWSKLGQVYYKNADDFVAASDKIGSTIVNLVRNNNVGTADLLKGALTLAPIASAMQLPIDQLLALVATEQNVSATGQRSINALYAALQKEVKTKSIEDIAYALQKTPAAVREMEAADPVGFFEDLSNSISNIPGKIDKIRAADTLFGAGGGKAVLALTSNVGKLTQNLDLASSSYAKGTALQQQFAEATDSVSAQLAILHNNLTFIGTIFADAVLPYITKFIALAVPALQLAAGYFNQLGDSTKIAVVGIALLAAVAGPAIVALGTLFFSVGNVITGFAEFAGLIGGAIAGVVEFGASLIGLLSPFSLIGAVVGTVAIAAYYIAQDLADADSLVSQYIQSAYNWGYNLISSMASGVIGAAQVVYDAVYSVIDSFVGLIQSFSPPKKGPLKDITTWGKNLFGAYADGFAQGDISGIAQKAGSVMDVVRGIINGLNNASLNVFSDTLNSVQSVISKVGAQLGTSQEDLQRWTAKATVAVGNFVTGIQNGTAASLNGISKYLGGLTGDFENLIKLQEEYGNAEQRLKEIEDAIKGITAATNEQVAAILKRKDLTSEEQAILIRQARSGAAGQADALNSEKASLEAKQASLKDAADRQKKTIDILSGLIFPAIPDDTSKDSAAKKGKKPPKPKKGPKPPDTPKFDFKPLERGGGTVAELGKKFDDTGRKVDTFVDKMGRAKNVIDGFIAGITGKDVDLSKQPAEFVNGFLRGKQIYDTVEQFLIRVQGYEKTLGAVGLSLKTGFDTFFAGVQAGFDGLDTSKLTENFTPLQNVIFNIGLYAGLAVVAILGLIQSVSGGISELITNLGKSDIESPFTKMNEAWQKFKDNFDLKGIIEDIKGLATPLTSITVLFGVLSAFVYNHIDDLAGALGKIAKLTFDRLTVLAGSVGAIAELVLISLGYGNVGRLADNLALINKNLAPYAGGLADGVIKLKDWIKEAIANAAGSEALKSFGEALGKVSEVILHLTGLKKATPLQELTGTTGASDTSGIDTFIETLTKLYNAAKLAEGNDLKALGAFVTGFQAAISGMQSAGSNAGKIDFADLNKALDLIAEIAGTGKNESDMSKALTVFYFVGGIFGAIAGYATSGFTNLVHGLAVIDDSIHLIGRWNTSDTSTKVHGILSIFDELSGFNPFQGIVDMLTPKSLGKALNKAVEDTIAAVKQSWEQLQSGVRKVFGGGTSSEHGREDVSRSGGDIGILALLKAQFTISATAIQKIIDDTVAQVQKVYALIKERISLKGAQSGGKSSSQGDGSKSGQSAGLLEGMFKVTGEETEKIVKETQTAIAAIWAKVLSAMGAAKDTVANAAKAGKDIAMHILDGVKLFFEGKSAVSGLGISLFNLMVSASTGAIKLLHTAGQYMAGLFRDGLDLFFKVVSNFEATMSTLLLSIATWIGNAIQRIKDVGGAFAQHVIEGIKAFFALVASFVQTLVDSISTWITTNVKNIWELGKSFGKAVIDGLVDFFKNSPEAVYNALKSVFDAAIEKFKEKFTGGGDTGQSSGSGSIAPSGSAKTGKAAGDEYFKGGVVELGEEGRELAFLPQGTRILNHRNTENLLRNQASGATTNLNISISVDATGNNSDASKLADVIGDKVMKRLGQQLRLASLTYG